MDVSNNFVPGVRAISGPATVQYIAINPLLYPNWTMTVNNVVVDGPSVTLTGSSQNAIQAIDNGLATPAPQSFPSPSPAFIPAYAPVPQATTASLPNCSTSDLLTSQEPERIRYVNQCYESIRAANALLNSYKDGVPSGVIPVTQDKLANLVSDYNALVLRTSSLLGSRSARCGRWDDKEDATFRCASWPNSVDAEIANLDSNILEYIIGGPDYDDPVTAYDIILGVSKLQQWPAADVANLEANVTMLQTALSVKVSSAKSKKPVGAFCFDGDPKSNATSACQAELKRIAEMLKPEEAAGTQAVAYSNALTTLQGYTAQRLTALSLSRFHFRDSSGCRGLNSSSRTRTYVLQLDAAHATSISVVCQSRIFLSEGIGFSTLGQGTYSAVPINPLKPPSPLPSPVPSGLARIGYINTSDLRPIPVTLVNYELFGTGQKGEAAIYSSFGLGLVSTAQNTYLDYVGGLSWGMTRSALLTAGLNLSQQNVLPPGYHVNDFVTSNPPTDTRYRTGFVLVVTYGRP